MNERIKDLLHKTGVHDNWNDADWYSLSPGMLGEFAELIVKECASLCEARAWGMIEKGFPGHEAVEMCSDAIKEHFGVKE